ncbi:DUF3515 family protein [Luteimicrobium album]|uniref:DUF3515 family protein n=1 Tax=Luteimicrobium album TaxID=1054550 RepID=UPI0024E08944|nr:DUF3515 family protein [Luteimicrobium album]
MRGRDPRPARPGRGTGPANHLEPGDVGLGQRGGAITLRCGVAQPGPSDQCQSIANPDGTSVDWITAETSTGWTFVTYGRDPAIEVRVPRALGEGQPTVALVDVAPAVLDVRATTTCTG